MRQSEPARSWADEAGPEGTGLVCSASKLAACPAGDVGVGRGCLHFRRPHGCMKEGTR